MKAQPFAAACFAFPMPGEAPRSTGRCGASCLPRSISVPWSCRDVPRDSAEAPLTAMSALMEQLADALEPLMGVPFGFFGHSVGSCMAFEAARQLRSVDQRSAVHLFVSGRGSPDVAAADHRPARRAPTTICSQFWSVLAAHPQQSCSVQSSLPLYCRPYEPTLHSWRDMELIQGSTSPVRLPRSVAQTTSRGLAHFSRGEASRAESFEPAFSREGISISRRHRPLSPGRSSRICSHPAPTSDARPAI